MRVLLTNARLEQRAGSELYVLDVARWLRDHGHKPVAYSARLGALADEFEAETIPVISDPAQLGEPPDVIHGQHHLATMAALATYPLTPAIGFCHGWTPWEETPLRHPAIRRYVAVSEPTRERLVTQSGIPGDIVSVLPNFVDLPRFPPRGPLPAHPIKALVFSNHARPGNWFDAIREACESRGISVEVAGIASGQPREDPGTSLREYDLVFAKGRSALEAMAAGAAVIICDLEGCGPFASPDGLDGLIAANFGHLVMRHGHRDTYLGEQIDSYEPEAARAVSETVRASLGRDSVVPSLMALYEEAIEDTTARPHAVEDARTAEQRYLRWIDRNYPTPELESVSTLQRHAYELQDALAYAQVQTTKVQAALEAAVAATREARADAATARADAATARAELERLESNLVLRWLVPRLVRLRSRLVPIGSRRHRLCGAVWARSARSARRGSS